MDITPEEFVERLLSDKAYEDPTDDCSVDELHFSLPPWYDDRKYKAGQRFYNRNIYGFAASTLIGLASDLTIPTILHVLVRTRRSSSPFTAYRRYASTFMHIFCWSQYEMKPGTRAWNSVVTIRKRHLKVGKKTRALKTGTISQRDLALTQCTYLVYAFLCPDVFGIQAVEKDSWEGLNHMFRTILYMIGLKDEYNVYQGTVEETIKICRILMKQVFAPLLEFPAEPYDHTMAVAYDGMWSILPLVGVRSGLFLVRRLSGVPGYVYTEKEMSDFREKILNGEIKKHIAPVRPDWHKTYPRPHFDHKDFYCLSDVPEYKKLNIIDKSKLRAIHVLAAFYTTFLGKIFLNAIFRFLLFLTVYFPILAIVRWGFSNTRVNMFGEYVIEKTKPLSNSEVRELLDKSSWYKTVDYSKKIDD